MKIDRRWIDIVDLNPVDRLPGKPQVIFESAHTEECIAEGAEKFEEILQLIDRGKWQESDVWEWLATLPPPGSPEHTNWHHITCVRPFRFDNSFTIPKHTDWKKEQAECGVIPYWDGNKPRDPVVG